MADVVSKMKRSQIMAVIKEKAIDILGHKHYPLKVEKINKKGILWVEQMVD